jgi:hypothetical protein
MTCGTKIIPLVTFLGAFFGSWFQQSAQDTNMELSFLTVFGVDFISFVEF